ncbi:MAG: DUF1634 domain-containing protein [Candidatus Binataceae bacterium]|nr:DUF1634 domain-containing protein [Candidatus Binataceae bacterium]
MANALDSPHSGQVSSFEVQDENRILRRWTPILLRTILIIATIILVIGVGLMAAQTGGAYVSRYRAIQAGKVYAREPWGDLFRQTIGGDPHAIVTTGLMVLTLVPLARVAFCFLLFIRERDWIYVLFTAYVLAGLVFGIVLGRVG